MDLKEIEYEGSRQLLISGICEHDNEPSGSIGKFLDQLSDC
jgi:hypothetical protein